LSSFIADVEETLTFKLKLVLTTHAFKLVITHAFMIIAASYCIFMGNVNECLHDIL